MLYSHATVAQGEAIRGQWSPCLGQDGLIVSNFRLDCLSEQPRPGLRAQLPGLPSRNL